MTRDNYWVTVGDLDFKGPMALDEAIQLRNVDPYNRRLHWISS